MKWKNFREGLDILDQYIGDNDYVLDAYHDVILVGPGLPDKVSASDSKRLRDLGWSIDRDSEAWKCFT